MVLLGASLFVVLLTASYVIPVFYADQVREFDEQLLEDFPIAVPLIMAIVCLFSLLLVRKKVKTGVPLEGYLAYHAMFFGVGLVVYVVWTIIAILIAIQNAS